MKRKNRTYGDFCIFFSRELTVKCFRICLKMDRITHPVFIKKRKNPFCISMLEEEKVNLILFIYIYISIYIWIALSILLRT